MNNPTLYEGGPLWLMATLALVAWIVWAVMAWRQARPLYRRETGRKLTVPILFGLKATKRR